MKRISLLLVAIALAFASSSNCKAQEQLIGSWCTQEAESECTTQITFYEENGKVEFILNGEELSKIQYYTVERTPGKYWMIDFYSSDQFRKNADGEEETYRIKYTGLVELLKSTNRENEYFILEIDLEDQNSIELMRESGKYEMSDKAIKLYRVS